MAEKMSRSKFLGAKLNRLAEAKGVSKETVYNETKIGKGALYRYFSGDAQQPDAFALVKLARYFGVSIDYLVGTNDDDVERVPAGLATVEV